MNSTSELQDQLLRVGVVGGTGYTGQELLRLLAVQPHIRVAFATSRGSAGARSPVPDLLYVLPDDASRIDVDVVFLCLPHGEAAAWVDGYEGGAAIIDLTADHRPGSGGEAGWVYGLAEQNADLIRGADRIANPGCYPTGVLLSLIPLRSAGLVDDVRLTVVNAASGVTGAGRTPRPDLLFAEVTGNYRAYGQGNEHRHLREIRSLLPERSILFQPHLLPVPRGILETIILPVRDGVTPADVREAWETAYAGSSVVRILDSGLPDLTGVVGTDRLDLGVCEVARVSPDVVTVVAAFDNLGKGAAGQALQNLNLMQGWPADRGLRC
jgi:N-acetyl-gamma-glutamyl-phosphate reductase